MARKLPSWSSLQLHFPRLKPGPCADLIGGKVKVNYDIGVFTNFCAIRVSRALNLSGHKIPFFKDTGANGGAKKPAVSSGKNGHWYIFRVRSLRVYLEKHYGHGESIPVKTYKDALKKRKGIILYEVPGWTDASGHIDCWNGFRCLGIDIGEDVQTTDYGPKSSKIHFWEAPSS